MTHRFVARTFFLLISMLVLTPIVSPPRANADSPVNHVVIRLVQVGTAVSSTDEYVELFNPTPSIVNLSNWRLAKRTTSGTESNLLTEFANIDLTSGSTYLIAHPIGYTDLRTPDARYSTTASLSASNTIILYSDQGHTIADLVGMGTAPGEGTSAANPPNDSVLVRTTLNNIIVDTDNNQNDFVVVLANEIPAAPQVSLPVPVITPDPTPVPDVVIVPPEETVTPPVEPAPTPIVVDPVTLPDDQSTITTIPPVDTQTSLPDPLTTTPASDPTADTSTSTTTDTNNTDAIILPTATEPTATQTPIFHDVVINEFMALPPSGEDEWVELYNRTNNTIDLTGWGLVDGGDHRTTLSGTLGTNATDRFLVINKPSGNLNNDGDNFSLLSLSGTLIDNVAYGEWQGNTDNAPLGATGQSTARRTDGNVESDVANDFSITTTPTKGTTNIITAVPAPTTTTTSTNTTSTTTNPAPKLVINEIYPDPVGSDDEEFIEIMNTGTTLVNLVDWQITDNHGQRYIFATGDIPNLQLAPGELLAVKRATTHLALHNESSAVTLRTPTGSSISKISYDDAPEGQSWALVDSRWRWTISPTFGKTNAYTHGNRRPVIKITWPTSITIGEPTKFSTEDTIDPDNDPLLVTWRFSDGQTLTGVIITRDFTKNGKYQVEVTIDDQHGGVVHEQHTITVTGAVLGLAENTVTASAETKPKTTTALKKETAVKKTTSTKATTAKKSSKAITVHGLIAAPPQTIHIQYAYLINVTGDSEASTIILDVRIRPLPLLIVGDEVTASGTLASGSSSTAEKRLVVTGAQDLAITAKNDPPVPLPLDENNDGSTVVGALVTTHGTIVSSTAQSAVLVTATGETLRLIAPMTVTAWHLTNNTQATATGILQSSSNGWRLLLRSNDDLVSETPTTVPATNVATNFSPPQRTTAIVITTLGTMLALSIIAYQQRERLQKLFSPKTSLPFSETVVNDEE